MIQDSTPEADPPTSGPRPDPGTPQAALLSWILSILLIGGVVYLNQFTPKAPRSAAQGTISAPVDADLFTLYAKVVTKIAAAGYTPDKASRESLISNVDASAQTPVERLRAALIAADIGGSEAGSQRLALLEGDTKLQDDVRAQIPLFRRVVSGETPTLTAEEREQLVKDHGWFGKLALTRGKPATDPEREPLVRGGWKFLALGAAVLILALIVVLGGLSCFVAMIVLLATGRIRPAFDPPVPGGSVYLEMIPVFAGAFLAIKIGLPALTGVLTGGGSTPQWAILAMLLVQWSLVVIVFWPRIRGVPWSRARQDLGWHSGRGIGREMMAGLFGYFAALPLLLGAMAVTALYVIARQAAQKAAGETPTPPDNPIIDVISNSSTLELCILFTLTTLWAPIVEETLFRGGLYRHLRGRVALPVAVIVSAFAFGVMHGYEFFTLLPVMTLGLTFALLREWRGSLVGPMFVHGLHNATIMALVLSVFSLARG